MSEKPRKYEADVDSFPTIRRSTRPAMRAGKSLEVMAFDKPDSGQFIRKGNIVPRDVILRLIEWFKNE
jgi:hypothetical protein